MFYLNELTRAHLLGLRAEALLCLCADKSTPTSIDAYVGCKQAATLAYKAAGGQADFDFWALRVRSLEQSIDFHPSLPAAP